MNWLEKIAQVPGTTDGISGAAAGQDGQGGIGNIGEAALIGASFIPGIGSAADFMLVLNYINMGDYLGAGLALIGAVPGLGDAIGDGALAVRLLGKTKGEKATKALQRLGPSLKSAKDGLRMGLPTINAKLDEFNRKETSNETFKKVKSAIPRIKSGLMAFVGNPNDESVESTNDSQGSGIPGGRSGIPGGGQRSGLPGGDQGSGMPA